MEEIRKFLQQILSNTDGLFYIYVTDKDGVPFMKVNSNTAPDLDNRLHFLSNFSAVADQASKLRMGHTLSITSVYSNYQVIQVYYSQVVVTFIADVDANTGYIHNLESQLEPFLNDLKDIIAERQDK